MGRDLAIFVNDPKSDMVEYVVFTKHDIYKIFLHRESNPGRLGESQES